MEIPTLRTSQIPIYRLAAVVFLFALASATAHD
ncbi:MAG: hypothetical protein ACI8W8_001822, partial [Rhodothermales bacterium]